MSEKIEANEKEISPEKPPFLYHGSSNKEIEELEPRQRSYRDSHEGPQIFASPKLSVATMFMIEGTTASGFFDSIPYIVIVGSREEIAKRDTGGHIYVLPSDTFVSDPSKGLGKNEWTSDKKVKPIKTIEYPSALDAMMENDVQVYIVPPDTYEKIRESDDHGFSILSKLESENALRGVNAKQLINE